MKKYTIRVATDNGWYDITPTFPLRAAIEIGEQAFLHTDTEHVEIRDDEGTVIESFSSDAHWSDWVEGTPI